MATGKDPKLGEQIVPPPTQQVVKPQPETSPSGLSTGPAKDEKLNPIPPTPPVQDPPVLDGEPVEGGKEVSAEDLDLGPTILLEGSGQRIPCDARDMGQFRVRGHNGLYYEHVSNAPRTEDHPEGEWEYRQTN